MFSLKAPLLLKFDGAFRTSWGHETLKNLFGIEMTPSDTQMRSILDSLPTSLLHQSFKILIDFVRLKKRLKDFSFLSCQKFDRKPLYLMAVDATGFFSSSKIMCPSYLVKSKGTENERYHHQLLAATMVHPELKTVLPVGAEAIENKASGKAARRPLKGLNSIARCPSPHYLAPHQNLWVKNRVNFSRTSAAIRSLRSKLCPMGLSPNCILESWT